MSTFITIAFAFFCAFVAVPVSHAAKSNIYGEHEPISMTQEEQQGLVAALTILLFILMAMDITGPEVLFLIALMILCLAQVLTLSETLSGTPFDPSILIFWYFTLEYRICVTQALPTSLLLRLGPSSL
jgi:hypothetical protein